MQIGNNFIFFGYLVIAGGLLIGSLMVQYGNKLNQQSSEQKILTQQKESEKAIREDIEYLKRFLLKGNDQLVKQIPKRDKWDFRTGTIVFHILKNNFFNNEELNLLIVSKDQKDSIRFNKSKSDYIKFIYEFAGLRFEKGYQVAQSDIQKRDTTLLGEKREFESVFLGFAWDLSKKKVILWINGVEVN